jgi:hypothetical protein
MASDHLRLWYAALLRLYSKRFRDRFGEGMAQSFNDLCRDRRQKHGSRLGLVLWVFAETSAGIVRENMSVLTLPRRRLTVFAAATGLLLLVPAVAMQFTDEVRWSALDFVTAGCLLFGAGIAYELVSRRAASTVTRPLEARSYRVAAAVAVLSALFLVWANLAVGLIGNEQDPVNLMYFGVLVVGAGGALLSRFRPQGMARALGAMTAIALFTGMQRHPGISVLEILGVNAFFAVLFASAALLFRRAARPPAGGEPLDGTVGD